MRKLQMPFVQHHRGSRRQAVYIGGLRCSGDGQHCAVAEGFNEEERTFHMEYTWEYFDWNDCLIPNTTTWTRASTKRGYHQMLPQAPGFEKRHQLYQLFHLLNHYVICTSISPFQFAPRNFRFSVCACKTYVKEVNMDIAEVPKNSLPCSNSGCIRAQVKVPTAGPLPTTSSPKWVGIMQVSMRNSRHDGMMHLASCPFQRKAILPRRPSAECQSVVSSVVRSLGEDSFPTTLFSAFSVVLHLMLLLLILPATLSTIHSKHVKTSYIVLQVDI